jgi:hypothetical protein
MTGIKQIDKYAKQIGKTSGRRNITESLCLSSPFPLVITDCVNDFGSFLRMGVMLNFLPYLPAPVSVQEKEAFYRRL